MSVGDLSGKDMDEIRQLKNPPLAVRRTLEAVFLLLHAAKAPANPKPPDWARVQRMLSDANFLARMQNFDASILNESPALTAYVASEYFGSSGGSSGGDALAMRRTHSMGSLRLAESSRRPRATLSRKGSTSFDESDPLTFSRVFRASKATAALFRWSALVVVQAIEASLPRPPSPPPTLPPATRPPPVVADAPLEPPVPPTPAPLTPVAPPAPAHPTPVPQPPSPTPAFMISAPNRLAEHFTLPSVDAAVAPSPARLLLAEESRKVLPPRPAPTPAKPKRAALPQAPDRHFELLSACVYGSVTMAEEGMEALQTVAATYCMRRRLQIEMVASSAPIENEALARNRLVAARDWLVDNGVPEEALLVSKESGRIAKETEDPGIVCKIVLSNDKVLRDFFLLVEQGESRKDAGTKDTLNIARWLEEQFQVCRC